MNNALYIAMVAIMGFIAYEQHVANEIHSAAYNNKLTTDAERKQRIQSDMGTASKLMRIAPYYSNSQARGA